VLVTEQNPLSSKALGEVWLCTAPADQSTFSLVALLHDRHEVWHHRNNWNSVALVLSEVWARRAPDPDAECLCIMSSSALRLGLASFFLPGFRVLVVVVVPALLPPLLPPLLPAADARAS